MSFASDYNKLRKKRLEEEEKKSSSNDIAPVYTSVPTGTVRPVKYGDSMPVSLEDANSARAALEYQNAVKEDEEAEGATKRTWFQAGAFDDGYQFGDITKTLAGTASDVTTDLTAGVLGIGESFIDFLFTASGGLAEALGAKSAADWAKDFVARDIIDEQAIAKGIIGATNPYEISTRIAEQISGVDFGNDIEKDSLLGDKTDSLVQSGGQLLGTFALTTAGVPWWLTSGTTSFGSAAEGAFNEGASYGEAVTSATISAVSEILTEKLFGGSGLGEKGLINLDPLTKGISSKVVKALADFGVDMAAEGFEEFASSVASRFGSSLYKEENIGELLTSEEALDEYLESFIGGSVLGGFANVGKTASSIKTGRDYRTGLTENEQKVVDKVYEDRIAEAEKDGKKLTSKVKAEIHDSVLNELKKGYIGIDTIESVLGGESYKSYQDAVANEEALQKEYDTLYKMKNGEKSDEQIDRQAELKRQLEELKANDTKGGLKAKLSDEVYNSLTRKVGKRTQTDGYLLESYNERVRRTQKFEADVNQYEGKAKESIQNIINKGQIQNTNRAHDIVDFAVRSAADRGYTVTTTTTEEIIEKARQMYGEEYVRENFYEYNEKTKKWELATIPNAEIDSEGKVIALNVDSPNLAYGVIGHEIGHTLEKSKHYGDLKDLLFEFESKKKGEKAFAARKQNTEQKYKNIKGANADFELTNDLIGEYIYTADPEFVKSLYTKNSGLFQTIWDRIKYLYKMATAGSAEQRDLLRIERQFAKVYRDAQKMEKEGYSKASGVATEGFVGSYSGTQYNATQAKLLADVSTEGIQNATDLASRQDIGFNHIGISDAETKQAWLDAGLAYTEKNADGDDITVVNEAMLMDERERRQKLAKTEGKKNYSLGYHAGDLGKAESLGNQSGGRDTGHYGTGTYFVGDEAKITDSYYGNRPHETVDFDKYKLYQPKTANNAGALHEFLKGVNYYYDRDTNLVSSDEEIETIKEQLDELRYEEMTSESLEEAINLVSRVAGKLRTNDALWSFLGDVRQSGDGTFYDGDKPLTLREVAEAIEDKDYAAYKLEQLLDDGYVLRPIWRYQEWNESISDAAEMLGISEDRARQIISDIRAEIEAAGYDYKARYTADSASTRFMKALGYEGVDVRGIQGYDNTAYGSVIYDLKGEDLARKQEIGTAKYSLTDKKSLDKYSQKQYNSFGWARYAEAISINELDDMYSKIQEKGSLKRFTQSSNGEAIIEVNDKPHTTLGANNVFAFVTGTKNSPEVTRLVRVNLFDEDSIELFRKDIYERNDRRTLEAYARVMGEEFVQYYDRNNSATYGEYTDNAGALTSGSEGEGNTPADRNGAQRSGTLTETQSNEIAPINEASQTSGVFFDGNKPQYSLSDSDVKGASDVISSLYNYDTVKLDKRVVDWNTEDFASKWNKGYYTSVVDTISKHTGKSKQDVWNAFADILMQNDGIAKVDGKTYINVHELSEDNLRKAFELGGLASPSIGVVDVDKPVTNFGSISLIFPDIFNPETVPTHYGDAYSTSLPAVAKFTNENVLEDALTYGLEGMEYSGILTPEETYDLLRDLEQLYLYDEAQRTSHTISGNGFRSAREFAHNYSVKSIDGLRKLYNGLSEQYESYERFLEDFAEKVFTNQRLHKDHTANPDFNWNDREQKFRNFTLDDAVDEMTARGDDDFKIATGERAKGYDEMLSKGMRARLKASSTGFYEVKPQRAVYIGEASYAVVPEATSADVIEMLESEGVKVVKYQPKEGYTGVADGRAEAIKGILESDTTGIRFSLSEAVEETNDLIAVHNLKSNELLKSLDLGGLPMPSIAVIKADAGHDQYGEISLIMPKETIDPQANRDNKVYGGDAWTPTYPRMEYKANEAVAKRVRDKYYELERKSDYDTVRPLYDYVYELENALNRYGGEEGLKEELYGNTKLMQVYLLDTGKGVIPTVQKEIRTELTDHEVGMYEFLTQKLGDEVIDGVSYTGLGSLIEHRKAYLATHGDAIKAAYGEFLANEFGFSEEQVQNVLSNTTTAALLNVVRGAKRYQTNGRVTIKTEDDYQATQKAIREAAGEGYKAWVDDLFGGSEEKSGIRNNVDIYTPSGNRRSWDALHWENTLENVVKAMRAQDKTGSEAVFGVHKFFATASKEYGSIAEIKADSDRLHKIDDGEYQAAKDAFERRLSDIATRIMDKGESNPFIAMDNAMECIVDAVRDSKTQAGIYNELSQYKHLNVTEKDVADIVSLVNDIGNMPTGYFEAKPMRAVGFDEVGVFVIPRNADVKLKQELLNRGYAIAEYDPDIEGDRQKVLNSFEKYKFSLSDVNETPKEYGNFNTYGKDIRLKDIRLETQEDIAPVNNNVETVNESVDGVAPVGGTIEDAIKDIYKRNGWGEISQSSDRDIEGIADGILTQWDMEGSAEGNALHKLLEENAVYDESGEVLANERQLHDIIKEKLREVVPALKAEATSTFPRYAENEIASYKHAVAEERANTKSKKKPSISSLKRLVVTKPKGGVHAHGVRVSGGKQYMSCNGFFVVELNNPDKSLVDNDALAVDRMKAVLESANNNVIDGGYEIDPIDISLIRKEAPNDNRSVVIVGENCYDLRFVDAVMKAIENPTISVSAFMQGNNALLIKGSNGQALILPINHKLGGKSNGVELRYVYKAEKVGTAEVAPEGFAPVTEEQANAKQTENIETVTDADVPAEVEAPYYGDGENVAPYNPFANRDYAKVGNPRTQAYIVENPEAKPFFKEAATAMLGDLQNSQKGERWYNDELYYESGGETGFGGTKRETTADIADLLDGQYHYTYQQIESALNAIINDKPLNACAKRIEFALNDRLMNGYTDIGGNAIPANQDYLNLLSKQQTQEAYQNSASAEVFTDADAPAVADGDIAPVAPVAEESTPVVKDKAYEAIRPKRESKKEPKMARVKEGEDIAPTSKVAEILTEEPETAKKKSAWSKFVELFGDKQAVFEKLSLKTKNRELMAKADFLHRSEARAQRFIGKGADGVKALNDVRAEVERSGKTEQFYKYMYHALNVDRMTLEERYDMPNKAVFGDSVTAEASKQAVAELEAKNPQFKKWAKELYDITAHLRKQLVHDGVISQETADLWAEMYPHYVPIRRVGDSGLNINVPLDTGRTGVNAPIKRATGGSSDILPLFDTMAMRIEQTYKAGAKNSFGLELKNTLGTTIEKNTASLDEVIDNVDNHEELLKKGENGANPTFTVFENGERVTFEITEEMYDALKPAEGILGKTSKTLNAINNVRRGLITEYNPVFLVTNAIKDAQDVLINSQHAAKTYANIPNAIIDMASGGKWYREYMENGGESNTYFDGEKKAFSKEDKGIKKIIGMPLRAISAANNFVERAPRLAEYIASRKAGASVEVAMLDAARVTTNFAAGGDVTKFLNRNGATFLNASVQGAMQQVRNVREAKANGLKGWVQLAAKTAVAGIPALILNNLLWDDDEEYEELSDYVKDNYYIVAKYGDGQFVRIPKGRTVAVIQEAFEQVSNALTGDDEVDLANFLELAVSNLAPNNPIDNNIISPIAQAITNKTWYGEDLVPTSMQDLPAAEQYDESTDAISKWLGEKLNISPMKLNYLLDQYSGGVGDVFLPMLTPEAERGDDTLLGNIVAPFKDKFTTDSVLSNQNVSDFYATRDELAVNANGRGATDEDILKSKYFNSVSAELSELYKLKREVQNSNLSDARKYEKVRDIQEAINAIARESLNAYNDVYIDDGYAVIGDREYRLNDKGEWQKISDKQADKQDDVISDLGISESDYWSNKSEYDFAYEYPEKYAVAKSVGGYESYKTYNSELYDIKADKDEYGKSISGSRKEKVAEYINSLDIDYGMKIILFKSEYKADDTYNNDIVEYLNSREDISYEEMVTILTELGFTVKNGTVYWD